MSGTDNLALPKVYGSIAARITNRIVPEPNTGCWLWLGTVASSGYGTMTVNRRTMMAHRASYEAFSGPIGSGLHIDHKCKVRSCVNPSHLEAVTVAENNRRSPRTVPPKTHCVNGHELAGANLAVDRRGFRSCKICRRNAALAYYYRMKAQ